jgi:hypothetical protein
MMVLKGMSCAPVVWLKIEDWYDYRDASLETWRGPTQS